MSFAASQNTRLWGAGALARKARHRFALWGGVYMAAIVYCSVVVGPLGFNFVPRSPFDAWQSFVATPYVDNDSSQRADWMANLAMLVPLGFMVTGASWARHGRTLRIMGSIWAFALSVFFVVAVKYTQLFFPPRTVSLNYILAQTLGAALGVLLFWLTHSHRLKIAREAAVDRGQLLSILLSIYIAALVLFMLVPFDFVLNADDLSARFAVLPVFLTALPGDGHALGLRMMLIALGTLSVSPYGVLLAIRNGKMSWLASLWAGFQFSILITFATLFLISGVPHLVALLYRPIGVALGAQVVFWIKWHQIDRYQKFLSTRVVWVAACYLILVLFANGLVTSHWRSVAEALDALDYNGLIPLWHEYIVSKAEAIVGTTAHFIMYAPIGILLWLVRPDWRNGTLCASILAGVLSLLMEMGRWMKPGLQPDFNNVLFGALAAACAFSVAPLVMNVLIEAAAESPSE